MPMPGTAKILNNSFTNFDMQTTGANIWPTQHLFTLTILNKFVFRMQVIICML